MTDHLLPSWTQGIWLVWYLVVGKSLNLASVDALISPPLQYVASYLGYVAIAVFTILRVCSFFAVLYAMFLPHVNLRTVNVPEEGPGDPYHEEGRCAHSEENQADEASTMDPEASAMRFRQRFIIVFTQILPPGWWPSMTRLLMYLLGKLFLVARFIVPRELITAMLLCVGLWIYQEILPCTPASSNNIILTQHTLSIIISITHIPNCYTSYPRNRITIIHERLLTCHTFMRDELPLSPD